VVLVAGFLVVLSPSVNDKTGAGPSQQPVVAYYTDEGVGLAGPDGAETQSFGPFHAFSLDGSVFAAHRIPKKTKKAFQITTGFDAATGEKLFRIKNAAFPVVLDGGKKVAFLPDSDGRRDPQVNSIWMRGVNGRIRKIVQFSHGGGLPGIETGLDGVPLSLAFDDKGTKVAVAYGNDVDLFQFDVWLVDVKSGDVERMTKGKQSRWPSLSPSGERLAVFRETENCGGPEPGYRSGNIITMQADGEDRVKLTEGSCTLFYTDPKWLSEEALIAHRLIEIGPGSYQSDLVQIDRATGTVTVLVDEVGDVYEFSVSPGLEKIAYVINGEAGFYLRDLSGGTAVHVPIGFFPKMSGDHAW
jgi:hypothetical protein